MNSVRSGIVAAALCAAVAAPGQLRAQEGPSSAGAPYAHGEWQAPDPAAPAATPASSPAPAVLAASQVDARAREDWIAECAQRRSGGDSSRWARKHGNPAGQARTECARYLDDYYAYYAAHARAMAPYAYGPGAAMPVQTAGCCQAGPMMMVPIVRMPRGEPECTETVEYIEEPVRVRPRARPRPAPDKRIRVAPDKRVKVQ